VRSVDRELVRELRRFAAAGLTVKDALIALAEAAGRLGAVARGLLADIEAGASLGEAMSKRPRAITPVYAALVEAGERSGRLVEALDTALLDIEHTRELRRTLLRQSAYPLAVLALALFLPPLSLALTFGRLPSYFGRNVALTIVVLLVVALIVLGPRVFPRGTALRRAYERLLLGVPFLRRTIVDSALWRPLHLEGALLAAGLSFEESLPLARRTIGWEVLRERWDSWLASIRSGGRAADGLGAIGILDADALGALRRAEQAGALDRELADVGAEMRARAFERLTIGFKLLPIFIYLLIAMTLISIVLEVLGGPVS